MITETELSNKLRKDDRHDHYWIEDGQLFESYNTIRGLRYRFMMDVPCMEDIDNVDDMCLSFIIKEYSK
jgi:hypothetical protein